MSTFAPRIDPFWRSEEGWPPDTPAAVFFGHALKQIGSAMISGWDGREFGAIAERPLPVPVTVSQGWVSGAWTDAELDRARQLIIEHDGVDAAPPLALMSILKPMLRRITEAPEPHPTARTFRPNSAPSQTALTPEKIASLRAGAAEARIVANSAVDRAREIVSGITAVTTPYWERAAQLRAIVTQACINEELIAGARDDLTGQINYLGNGPKDGTKWNAEAAYLAPRFTTCKVDWFNMTSPPRHRSWKTELRWLYLERSTLADFIKRKRIAVAAPAETWWPAARGIRKGAWAKFGRPADLAARERLKTAGNTSPAEAHICDELAAMWNEARPDDPTTGGSLASMRARAK